MATFGSGFSDLHVQVSRLKQALSCSICRSLMEKPAHLQCNHHFCMSCLVHAMKESTACPKCKQPATSRQAMLSPEFDNVVCVFQSLEASIVKMEEEVERQKLYVSKELMLDEASDVDEFGKRKRTSLVDIPCRGIFPASKRIQLPCPQSIDVSTGRQWKDNEAAQFSVDQSQVKLENSQEEVFPRKNNPQESNLTSSRASTNQEASADDAMAKDCHVQYSANAEDSEIENEGFEGANSVACGFCHKVGNDKVAGPIIRCENGISVNCGFKRTEQINGVHKYCAEWAPGVYYEDEVAQNIPQEVIRGQKIKCHCCGLKGGVLGCYVKRCRKSFHYPCARSVSCRWDDNNFLVLCPDHVASKFPGEGTRRFKTLRGEDTKESSLAPPIANIPAPQCISDDLEYKPEMKFSAIENPDEQMKVDMKSDVKFPIASNHIPASVEIETKSVSNIQAIHNQIPDPVKVSADFEHHQITTNFEHHQISSTTSRLMLCGSGLSPKANEMLSSFAHKIGAIVQRTWSSSVTHLIAGTDGNSAARRTFKYLMANLEGKWILKAEWLYACMAAGRLLNEQPYEVNLDIHGMIGGPCHARRMAVARTYRLFEGMKLYFLGDYAAAYKTDLEALIIAAGGEILPIIPEIQDEVMLVVIYNQDVMADTSMSNREEIIKSRYFEAKSIAQMAGAEVAGHTWILDSVAAYELQPFE